MRRRSGLHCTGTARLGLFRILIDESIKEMGERVQCKIGRGCHLCRGEDLMSMERYRWVEMLEERCLDQDAVIRRERDAVHA